MRLVLALALIATVAGPAAAGEVEDRQAAIGRIEADRAREIAIQRSLVATHQKKLAEVERQRKSRAWNAKTKREEAQADAQEVGKRLELGQKHIRDLEQRAIGERRGLLTAIDRELAGRPSAARRRDLERVRANEQQKIPTPVKKLRVPDERIDPLDDPEDLDEKAARLKKSEDELVFELQKAERRAASFKRQVAMQKASSRSHDPFPDTQKGGRTGHSEQTAGGRGAGVQADEDNLPSAGGGTGNPSQPPTGPAEGGDFNSPGATPTDPNPSVSPSGSAVDIVFQFSEVVDRSTIDALRSAERSSDPAVRAQAAERLAAALKARVQGVKQQRQAIERRAKQLRGP